MAMLISAVSTDPTMNVATCEHAANAWEYLQNRFDRDTGNTSIHLLRALTNLRYRDGENLRTHIDDSHQMSTRMAKRTMPSNQTVAKAMKAMFEPDEVKGSFFLVTLPDTMDHIIDISPLGTSRHSQTSSSRCSTWQRSKALILLTQPPIPLSPV